MRFPLLPKITPKNNKCLTDTNPPFTESKKQQGMRNIQEVFGRYKASQGSRVRRKLRQNQFIPQN